MFIFAILFGLMVAFIWDLLITGIIMFIFSVIGIPALDALSFWQIFGLLVAVSLATMRLETD